MIILWQGARYDESKLHDVANQKFFDVPCDSNLSFVCSVTLGDTDLSITQTNIEKFAEYMKNEPNDDGKTLMHNWLL